MYVNLYKNPNYSSSLSELGLNVHNVTKSGGRKTWHANIHKILTEIDDMLARIEKDKICAYSDFMYCGYFHVYPLLNGIVFPTKNRHCPMKLREICRKDSDKKVVFMQRLLLIRQQLAAASGLYNLRSGQVQVDAPRVDEVA